MSSRDNSARLEIEGPFNESGTSTGPNTELYLTQSSTYSASTDTQLQDIPTRGDAAAILAPLQGERDIQLEGDANGLRLFNSGIGSNPKDALQQWLIEFESLVLSQQGKGFKFVDTERQETLDPSSEKRGVLVSSVRWSYETSDGVKADWTLEGKYAEGFQEAEDRAGYISNEVGSQETPEIEQDKIETEDGSLSFSLGDVSSRDYEREVDLNVQEILHQYPDVPIVGVIDSGVTGSFNIEGTVTDEDVDLEAFSKKIVDEFHGQNVRFYDALTNRVFAGAFADSETSIEAGKPRLMEYRLDIDIGESII